MNCHECCSIKPPCSLRTCVGAWTMGLTAQLFWVAAGEELLLPSDQVCTCRTVKWALEAIQSCGIASA